MKVIGITPTARGTGDIEFRVHTMEAGARESSSESFVLDYESAWNTLTNLQSVLHRLADTRMRNAAAGDCPTCNNLRMVNVTQRGGHVMREHCPDCGDAWRGATPAFPAGPGA